jgi:exonuclease III
MGLTDIYRIFHPKTTEYTFFAAAHRTFSRISHILGYKTCLNKHKETEIISCVLSDHNGRKLEMQNYRKY